MSTISNQHYLAYLNANSSSLGSTASNSAGTDTLLAALNKTAEKTSATPTESAKTSTTPTDTVTLSEAAKSLIARNTRKNYGFVLNQKQQDQIQTVLQKYKDLPRNQVNYDSLQKDLKSLKLDTETLATKDRASSFNGTRMLLAAMRGENTSRTVAANTAATNAKKTLYAKQLVADWTSISAKTE